MRKYPSFKEFCNVDDEAKLFTIYPTANVNWPLIYRFDVKYFYDQKIRITPNDTNNHWAQFPENTAGDTDTERVYDPETAIDFTLNIASINTRARLLLGENDPFTFLVEAYYYSPDSEKRLMTEQYGIIVLESFMNPAMVVKR